MANFDNILKEITKEHNSSYPQIPDHPYRILTTGGSGSTKRKIITESNSQQPDIYKIYLLPKDPYQAK